MSETHYAGPTKQDVLKRLTRIEGQVRGIGGMVDANRYCIDIITQIQAVHAALDSAALRLLDDHIRAQLAERNSEATPELMDAIARLLRR